MHLPVLPRHASVLFHDHRRVMVDSRRPPLEKRKHKHYPELFGQGSESLCRGSGAQAPQGRTETHSRSGRNTPCYGVPGAPRAPHRMPAGTADALLELLHVSLDIVRGSLSCTIPTFKNLISMNFRNCLEFFQSSDIRQETAWLCNAGNRAPKGGLCSQSL